ncbi:DUF726 domain-containing protein [Histoplasma capsulatum var. duboisii H88]|uniref:DUF726 domain-containing protein n=2 Tax=Ajellomyces capsulatus TaxID=5037 RepID=F0UKU5_AJEC8|nr:DUF726 domain-containing protein [Histoplasma capsulatum H143]EGC46049.1 DUF726 domain-containing protein [Histoplasma capsulatum var. duboisii H88]QSS56676.1 DUF726 domain-containing protein [Histoplasma capsulatum var. duboisii H88]
MNPVADASKCLASSETAPAPAKAGENGALTPSCSSILSSTNTNKLEMANLVKSNTEGKLQLADIDEFGLPIQNLSQSAQPNNDELPDPENQMKTAEESTQESSLSKNDEAAFTTTSNTILPSTQKERVSQSTSTISLSNMAKELPTIDPPDISENPDKPQSQDSEASNSHKRGSSQGAFVSEWSHQRIAVDEDEVNENDNLDEDDWKDMPALGGFDVYDDYGRIVARGAPQEDDAAVYQGLGGAGKGYTRVQIDEDAQSVTSLDDDTKYLFKEPESNAIGVEEEQRDPLAQLQATKDLLTEGQRIAYVGVTRLMIYQMVKEVEAVHPSRSTKKYIVSAIDSMAKWGQQMMIRLYTHMDIDSAEQIMIEQLAEHGVQPADLVPPLMRNSRIKNPMCSETTFRPSTSSAAAEDKPPSSSEISVTSEPRSSPSVLPPPYDYRGDEDSSNVKIPSEMPASESIDIDIRWTVLCDLFLVLIADSTYDARSRQLLERVGESLNVSWSQICRFEKRVIDALEMQEEKSKETWDEAENMEARRKQALKKRYMIMGLATVGGGLVIGLSAGLLAPVIGAGLAAGFSTIGITGTGAFLGGAGGTALIASGATLTGGTIAVRASHRRTGAVKTFEYRPLHNNKRVNLIVTVSGWMTGKVDDVRLPFSTVDPIIGDIYSVLWEPEMLQSMGDTINILATEALTQGLQQVLGSTILVALMASLQLPIVLTKLSYLIDNPWNVSLVRANATGLIMADSIIARNLGNRPITLIGFSLGSRVIFSCLKELASKGAYGLIQNVYLFGSPIVANKDEYMKARSVVSGRFVNGYASNDWILGYLFRATSGGIMRVAGLAPVENVPGIENMDATQFVNGHMAYRAAMPKLLRQLGWEVESDEFTEIEDPDPDKHSERQRELIREIDEARKEAEAQPDKARFGFFKRGKLAEKKGWETYDVDHKDHASRHSTESGVGSASDHVLFDIDAIRAELESEQMEVKQLESTLPPIKIDLNTPSPLPRYSSNEKSSASSETVSNTEMRETDDYPYRLSSGTTSRSDIGRPRNSDEVNHDNHEDNIQMTFDTSYVSPPSYSPPALASSLSHDLSRDLSSRNLTPSPIPSQGASPRFGSINLNHNAWADDDYDERKDGDIKMTFG